MEPESSAAGRLGCPKRMVFGPCGGVREDERCELAEHRCVFLDAPLVRWPGAAPDPPVRSGLLARAAEAPVVLTDLSVPAFDTAAVRRVVGVLGPVSDGLLLGEHANRPDFPPTMLAAEALAAGARLWTTLACRDRNRVVLEQELAGLAALGVDGVLCVTGDGRGPGVRPGASQVFDLDGVRLAALAAGRGLQVAVPESPEAPPRALRPARVAEKQRAGAQLCVLNHVSSPARVASFVAAARDAGATLPFVAGSPSTPTSAPPACCSAFPACTSTTTSSSGSSPRPTRGRPASPPRSRRPERCSPSPASSGSTCRAWPPTGARTTAHGSRPRWPSD
ncbi:methylenetetrahydrofolate reductase [Blastococcus brunescens]|uniref:Methylenetetrahydrofolate reductase n=1 Tax=Blastococcus brunescens TaxID=1564165 RepID=A0ABZ1B3R2_9ACTN|nr:methylenetetrahydrofolate reductase [Blastococcus sp. BMG 8361]WRL64433.1 methylenetetrahydrofolate reductase [Blastococcus sp. BMG 8361]